MRRQKKKNEQEKVQRVQLVKRLSVERRAKTAEVKKTMHHEAEAKLEARRIREEKRSAQRAQQAAALAKQRKVLERELWIDADRTKQGLSKFMASGKADDFLLRHVNEADTDLVSCSALR